MLKEISLKRALILLKDLTRNLQEEFSRDNLNKSNLKVTLFWVDLIPVEDKTKLENYLSIKEWWVKYEENIEAKVEKFEKEVRKIWNIKFSISKANIETGIQNLINEMDLKKSLLEKYISLKAQDISTSRSNFSWWVERKDDDKDQFIIKKEKVISNEELDKKIKLLKKEIRNIENDITEKNANTKINVEVDEGDL